jgi:hypothetical protein
MHKVKSQGTALSRPMGVQVALAFMDSIRNGYALRITLFIILLAMAISLMVNPELEQKLTWLLVVLFASFSLLPDKGI